MLPEHPPGALRHPRGSLTYGTQGASAEITQEATCGGQWCGFIVCVSGPRVRQTTGCFSQFNAPLRSTALSQPPTTLGLPPGYLELLLGAIYGQYRLNTTACRCPIWRQKRHQLRGLQQSQYNKHGYHNLHLPQSVTPWAYFAALTRKFGRGSSAMGLHLRCICERGDAGVRTRSEWRW